MEKGLLSGVLPAVFSFSDVAKRKIADLFSNPVEYTQQLAGKVGDDVRDLRRLEKQAFADPKNPLQITDQEAFGKLADIYMTSLMNFAPMGMNVFHGSPHIFNKFDSSKIGTGEGAQAYGHGLYLAESPDVARTYQAKVSGMKGQESTIGGRPINWDNPAEVAAFELSRHGGNRKAAADFHASAFKGGDQNPAVKLLRSDAALPAVDVPGALYKVDLPDEQIAKMLDWDKPLSQQSKEVQKAWMATKKKLPANAIDDLGGDLSLLYGKDITPGEFLGTMQSLGGSNFGEKVLQQQGIPGIRYLDQGSRGAGQGSSNFVVFPGNEGFLKILERNGKSLLD